MANDWEDIYSSYGDQELLDEITFLKEESKSIYISQSQGSKSFSRSLSDIKARLAAAVHIQQLKSGADLHDVGKVAIDFS